jgi:hypothetical protein
MAVQYSGSYATPRLDLGEAMKEYIFDPNEFVGMKILTPFLTPKRDGAFPKLRRESMLRRDPLVKRAASSGYSRGDFDAKDQTYACEERGHEIPVDHSLRAFYASDFDADMTSAEIAMWRVMFEQENDIKDIIFNTSTYTTGNGKRTDVAAAWATSTTDIIGDVLAAKESVRSRTGMDANTMVIGKVDFPNLLKNAAIRQAVQYTQLPGIDAIVEALRALFGLDKLLVGGGVYNSANEGQAATVADVWGTGYAWIGYTAPEGASLLVPSIGRTMVWTADVPEAVMVEEYEEPQTRSTVIRARSFCDELEIDSSFGQLLDTAA